MTATLARRGDTHISGEISGQIVVGDHVLSGRSAEENLKFERG